MIVEALGIDILNIYLFFLIVGILLPLLLFIIGQLTGDSDSDADGDVDADAVR